MDDLVTRTATDPSPPRSARGRVLWPRLGVLALLLVAGTAWVRGPNIAVEPQPTPTVQPMDDMTGMDMGAQPMVEHEAAGHTEQMAHEEISTPPTVLPMDGMSGMDTGAQPMVEHPADGHTEQTAHETGESHGLAHEETSASPTVLPMDDMSETDKGAHLLDDHQADDHTEQTAHEETSAPAGEHEAHGQAGAHEEAPAPSLATKKLVLSGFAGVNLMVIAVAALLRRRTQPRLPKHLAHLQPQRESSIP